MTHAHDGSIDRPRARARPLPGRAPDHPPLAARADRRGRGARPPSPRSSRPARSADAPTASAAAGGADRRPGTAAARRARRRADARADAGPDRPRRELFVYNWADYMGEDVIPSFEKKTGVKVTYDFFDNYDTMFAKIGQDGGGYDITFPTSIDIPGFVERGLVQPLDHRLIPNIGRTSAPSGQDPGYDPGNAHSIPYMWWTTGVAYDTAQGARTPDQLERAVGRRSTRSTSRCSTTSARRSRRRCSCWARTPTRRTTPTSTPRSRCSRSRSRSSGSTRPTTSACCSTATPGSATPGARTSTRSSASGRPSSSTSPRRAASAARTRPSSCSEREAPGRRPAVHQPPARRARSARRTRTTSATWARTPRPRSSSTRRSWPTRPSTRTRPSIDKLEELLDLGADLEKYTTRWNRLRAGN